jgi:hypothetical protein
VSESFVEIPPSPSVMEAMRAHGYTLPTAIADLIDNSIAANARTITLTFRWSGSDSWISILDDGDGMSEAKLQQAMRLGSRSPLEEREPSDLGRFGLGLKTASLSQCRSLTVKSRQTGGSASLARWDLDYLARPDVNGWRLLTSVRPQSATRLEPLEQQARGTIVLLEVLDRIVGGATVDDKALRNHFHKLVLEVESHLEMVFHRLIENRQIRIVLNDQVLDPWDPFLRRHPATQCTPVEAISVRGFPEPVRVKGYVLPHKDKLGSEIHGAASGPSGWNAQQGFYLYRHDRLIVAGSWLGLGPARGWTKEEHYKLARLQLDVPSSMDHLWQLDVKKSSAQPPPSVAERLSGLAETVRKEAREVFSHRGRYGPRARPERVARPWKSVTRGGVTTYQIDREHAVLKALLASIPSQARKDMQAALRIIEETVPIQQIWLDAAERPDEWAQPFSTAAPPLLRSLIQSAYSALRRNHGVSHREAVELLLGAEEFSGKEAQAIIAALEEHQ